MASNYKTNFQAKIVEDKDTLWAIVKLFHPNIPSTVKDDLRAYAGNYHWVSIEFMAKEYGKVALCINNCKDSTPLWGDSVTKKDMQKAIKSGNVQFYIWRMWNDKLKKNNDDNERLLTIIYTDILNRAGYQIQTVDEWFRLYYQD